MRTLSGNCGGLTPALLFLRFVPLLLVLSAAFCRAESCEPGGSFPVETVASITPSTMYAGQTYNVVIMGSFPYDIPAYPGCNLDEDFVSSDLGDLLYQDVSILMEPDSEFYSQGTFSATEITLTITIGPDAPPGTAYLFLTSDGGAGTYVTFQIACPEPTITYGLRGNPTPSPSREPVSSHRIRLLRRDALSARSAYPLVPIYLLV